MWVLHVLPYALLGRLPNVWPWQLPASRGRESRDSLRRGVKFTAVSKTEDRGAPRLGGAALVYDCVRSGSGGVWGAGT